jgi:hypothetical protein
MVVEYFLAFATGFLVKTVDWLDDERKSKHPLKLVFALCYGIIIGHLISTASFSVLFLGAVIAQVFARKIDTQAHRLGFLAAAFSLFFFGVPGVDLFLFAYFLVLAFFDEVDYIGKWRPLETYRPFLQIGSLALLLVGRWDYLLAIIAFDAGYLLVKAVAKRFQKHKKRTKKK